MIMGDGSPVACWVEQALPNLIAVLRDKLHGGRRLTGRLFAADAYISGILQRYIRGKKSIVSIIENSPDIKDVYAKFVTKCKNNHGVEAAFQATNAKESARTCSANLHANVPIRGLRSRTF